MKKELSKIEFTDDYSNVLNAEVIGFDGYGERKGTIERISIQNHSVLGNMVQIWVKWNEQEKAEPFFPRQFERYMPSNRAIGVYIV